MTSSAHPVPAAGASPAVRSVAWLRRAWKGLRLRDALILTVPPLLAVTLVLAASIRDYARARQFDDYWSRGQSVGGYFSAQVHALAALPRSLPLRNRFDPADPDAGVIRLDLPGRVWDSLEADPLAMWGHWVDASLRYGATTVPVRIRKRGDNSVHWLTDKRTLTVRTPRDQFYKRFRGFGLSAKDVLPGYVANRMAQEFGLLAPTTAVVPVYLNNRFYGMFRFIEVVDESFLRPFDRMPGNIFRGEGAERGEARKGVPRDLFEDPYLWDRVAVSDRPTGAGAGQLELLLQDLNGTTLADHQRMMARLDRDEFARLFAYLFLVGDPYHMDGVHNQLIYEDPSTQQLHPIPWDVRLLRLSEPEKPLSYLFQAVLRDPFVVDATMRELGRRLADDGALRIADSLVRAAENRYAGYFAYDRLRQGLIPEVGDTATAMAILRANAAYLRRWLANDTIAVQVSAAPGGYLVDLEARGMVGADLEGFTVDRAVAGRVTLRLDSNRSGVPDAGDRLLALRSAGGGLQLDQPVPLYAAWDASQPSMRAGTQSYRLFVAGLPAGVKLVPELKNRATGLPAATVAWEAGSPVPAGSGWHAWDFPERVPRAERYSGTVRLHETVRIPAGDTLLIEPGTTLLLDPDVSVVSRGLVLAQGTAARPIRVLPSQPGVPWGTFSLLGHGADSSRFSYVEFAQGGGALVDRIEFTGMVNVHWANDVRFEHGFFHDNLRSDDTFHAMHSQVVVRESHFLRANSDAVDFDIAGGVVADNQFEQTGGDAIDLMTSTPRIFGNRISGSGDKGISVGEASRPFIFDNLIDSCDIGVEIKDRSEAVLLHNRLTNNRIGMRERRKNWRYGGGGWTTVAASVFAGNRTPLVRDPFSRLTLLDAVGLDSAGSAAVVAPGELGWLYASNGVEPAAPAGPGPVAEWRETTAVVPVDGQRFTDDFGPVSDGWKGTGGVTRLEKRRDALVAEVDRHPGTIGRTVDWKLPAGGTLVLEAAGRDLQSARVRVTGDAPVEAPLEPVSELATARVTTIALPPGQYSKLTLELAPMPGLTRVDPTTGLTVLRGGRLDLRGYLVLPAAAARGTR